ncbi:redox-sensing transcriptional repressor Rex [Gordonia sp. DT30]|uniref:redox-sensing transcriptional repressor Rex n=1 Tax=unclassified Gordonia (in: high G+C Gram-positive bacteria) TaxID=2657482 RepID=UPI003CF04804
MRESGCAAVSVSSAPGDIPDPTVARLAGYLYVLRSFSRRGVLVASSGQLATAAGVNPAILRKDLSYVGANGVRGVGYDVGKLTARVSIALHTDTTATVAVAGAGRLGQALLAHTGVGRGFEVAALFDDDPEMIGVRLSAETPPVAALDDIANVCADPQVGPVDIGVVATADEHAQRVAEAFAAVGIRQLLNVTPVGLVVESDVVVRQVDLALELQVLAFTASRSLIGPREDDQLRAVADR